MNGVKMFFFFEAENFKSLNGECFKKAHQMTALFNSNPKRIIFYITSKVQGAVSYQSCGKKLFRR